MNALLTFFIILYAIVCLILILLVIMQGGRAEGLFASAQANVLGSRGADLLTKVTRVLSAIFIIGALLISIFISAQRSALDAIEATDQLPDVVDYQPNIDSSNNNESLSNSTSTTTEPIENEDISTEN